MIGLTHKQAAALDYIHGYIGRTGASPTYEEIREHLGLKSKSRVHFLVAQLVERGRLVRLPGKARTLALPASEDTSRDALVKIIAASTSYTGADSDRLRGLLAHIRQLALEGLKS